MYVMKMIHSFEKIALHKNSGNIKRGLHSLIYLLFPNPFLISNKIRLTCFTQFIHSICLFQAHYHTVTGMKPDLSGAQEVSLCWCIYFTVALWLWLKVFRIIFLLHLGCEVKVFIQWNSYFCMMLRTYLKSCTKVFWWLWLGSQLACFLFLLDAYSFSNSDSVILFKVCIKITYWTSFGNLHRFSRF